MKIKYETIDELSLSLNILLKYHYLEPDNINVSKGKNKFKFNFEKDKLSLMQLEMKILNKKASGEFFFQGCKGTYHFTVDQEIDSFYPFIEYFAKYYKLNGHDKLSLKLEPENARF